ncbi:hypothetical protein [Denitromonas iodatirespirans]|uniref:Uncharacterized protein n=1 Tax=Denitromonas iodatirespirans TaxID=2795389 RepID=A0A944D567_DENI1|nr:hypothetical protein [Denitromonas iodatirespirans]MBT0960195.1 hypothetical protein [Denitromonas iodatirespirans]
MTRSNARLTVHFEFELVVPDALAGLDCDALRQQLAGILGDTVFKGMPTVSAKQLAKAGIHLQAHRHQLEAELCGVQVIDGALLASVAPHLTDHEVQQLCRLAAAKAPTDPVALRSYLRRQALKLVNDYRLVPCTVRGQISNGAIASLGAQLNLTNGGVLVNETHRKTRLKADQAAVEILLSDPEVVLPAKLSGHTLSGPVLAVDVAHLAHHRDGLQAMWTGQTVAG